MAYLWYKAFHLIGIVVWFAGLFYVVRLFVYHVEANEQPEPARTILTQQYQVMEKRLYNLITTPGMAVTVVMAIAIVTTEPDVLKSGWLHFKLALVAILIAYHFYCGRLIKQLAENRCNWSSQQLRSLNEVPTVLLVGIVLLAVFKQSLPIDTTILGIIGMIIAMAVIIQFYAKKRQENSTTSLAQKQQ
ncbi:MULTISPECIES: protoporphyrinogen oxidase HemJ [Aerosakkonema]|uniref:protoporphyrinogen oxidase HemJ n=1 Tax=Aerosakkonema TaxID=1246629 RepID=UPI0035BA8FFC